MFENRSGLAFRPDDALNMVSPASDKHHDDRVASRIGEFGTGLEMVVENDDARRQLSFQRITTILKMKMRSNLPTELLDGKRGILSLAPRLGKMSSPQTT